MMAPREQWLVTGHAVLENHARLWALCQGSQELLGQACRVIAEHPLGNCIEPWEAFVQDAWTRGRFFGENGEIQWRTYGPLVRVVVLVEAANEDESRAAISHLEAFDLTITGPEQFSVTTDKLALQTNVDVYSAAEVRSYGREDSPGLFVRYCRVGK